MRKISTLIYIMNDLNIDTETILAPYTDYLFIDDQFSWLMDMLDVDPGHNLVARTMERIKDLQ